jgi:hypothetical protein
MEEKRMLDNLIIRAEEPADYKNTELMAMRSFFNKYGPAADEHFLIRIIRESKDYIPQIKMTPIWFAIGSF